jgi:hypothetical protein
MRYAALALWLAMVAQTGLVVGERRNSTARSRGGDTLELPRRFITTGTIEMRIVSAALRNGISPSRALARAITNLTNPSTWAILGHGHRS